MVAIEAKDIQVAYGERIILSQLSCHLETGAITTIIGSNGCGKSTLLKALSRILPTQAGQVLLDGQDIHQLSTKEVATKLALLPQTAQAPEGIRVYDLVSYGRFPHQSGLGRLSSLDREKINWALAVTGLTELADQLVDQLSGGQRQRVWIAMALAQDTETIFLDEPTTYLDMNHQLEVLELLARLNHEAGKTIIMVLHDLNLAARFSDQLIAMKEGQICYQGDAQTIMTPHVLRDIFHIEAQIIPDPLTQRPLCLSYQLSPHTQD